MRCNNYADRIISGEDYRTKEETKLGSIQVEVTYISRTISLVTNIPRAPISDGQLSAHYVQLEDQ
jgi:hypothetical protein